MPHAEPPPELHPELHPEFHGRAPAHRPAPPGPVHLLLALALILAPACASHGSSSPAAETGAGSGPQTWTRTGNQAGPEGETASGRSPGAIPAEELERPLRVGFLVVDGLYNTELTAPWDVFHHAGLHTDAGLEVVAVSPDGGAITTFEGLKILPDHGFADAPLLDVLVVPAAEGSMGADLEDEELLAWVRERGRAARYVMSLCDGTFVLAAAGLLESHSVTTFPDDQKELARRFPELDLKINVSFVHDGPFITSVGGVHSYDPAMYLVEELYGEKVAARVARGLLLPWPPKPGKPPVWVGQAGP